MHQLGAVVPLPYIPRPEARTGILLNEIVAGGPSALPALMAYLHDARNGGSGREAGELIHGEMRSDYPCIIRLRPVPGIIGSLLRGTRHSGVLTGMGFYYTLGGRYHRPHQRTVYASDDDSSRSPRWRLIRPWNGRTGSAVRADGNPNPRPSRCPYISTRIFSLALVFHSGRAAIGHRT